LIRPWIVALALAAPAIAGEPEKAWEVSAALTGYDAADSPDYWNPMVSADYGRLHLETQYQYEALETFSVWIGMNFSAGKSWTFEATLLAGGIFGELEGVAPRVDLSLTHRWFEATTSCEYVFDTANEDDDFFYSWTEIGGYPRDWFRVGLAVQRTRVRETDVDIQRGPFVGFTIQAWDIAAYAFDPHHDPSFVLTVTYQF
jgi:hypothetical protein